MSTIASLITSLTIVYSTLYSDADRRKHQSPASPAFMRGIHRWPVHSPHKRPVTRKMFPFDDVIMEIRLRYTPQVFVCNILCTYIFQHHLPDTCAGKKEYCPVDTKAYTIWWRNTAIRRKNVFGGCRNRYGNKPGPSNLPSTILNVCQMPSDCYIIRLGVNSSTSIPF